MKNLLTRLVREEQGQDVIEYALLTAGISVTAIPMVPAITTQLVNVWTGIQSRVMQIVPPA